jgi:enterochelin esterase-like enzyme
MVSREVKKELVSPRISALKQQVEVGNIAALDAFWREVAAEGTPLIEPVEGDDQHALVTFLWRAEEPVEHVVLYSELLRGMWWNNWADALLHRLLETDLYYRTYRVRTDMRFVYWMSPNQPLVHLKDVKDWDEFTAHFQVVDPLNPNIFVQDRDRSYVEMPAAPPQPWHRVQPDVLRGDVERIAWHSELLNNDRQVWVYTPPGYHPDGEPYHLLVLFDGDIYTTHVPAPTIFDNLIAAKHIPPLVAVMLDSPDRPGELYCHESFAEFIAREFVPWIRQNYRVTLDPKHATVAGVSAGGVAAAFMGLRHSEVFGNILSNSGAFGWAPDQPPEGFWDWEIPPEGEWLIRQYANCEKLPLRFHLDAGLLEDQRDYPITTVLQANRHMRDVLRAKGYWVHYSEFCGGHQYITFRGTLADGLIALIGPTVGEQVASVA